MNDNKNTDTEEGIIDNRLEYFSFFPVRFVCYVIAFLGLCMILTGGLGAILLGSIFFILLLPIAIVQKRITVDLAENRYREYLSFVGIKIGKWYSFKGCEIITITHSDKVLKMRSTRGGRQTEMHSNSSDFYLNLKKDNYNKLNIAAGSYDSMLKKAIVLAHRYQVGIMDCSEKPNKKYSYEEIVQHFSK